MVNGCNRGNLSPFLATVAPVGADCPPHEAKVEAVYPNLTQHAPQA